MAKLISKIILIHLCILESCAQPPVENNVHIQTIKHDDHKRDLLSLRRDKHNNKEPIEHSYELPSQLNNLLDVVEPHSDNETPVFWHISKSGGTTVIDIFSKCFGFVVSSEVGVTEGHGGGEKLEVVELNGDLRYVNVDTTTEHGIERAKALNLAQSQLADVIVTPLFEKCSTLFDAENKGRMFTTIRHPIDRAVSMFYYLQKANWEPTFDPKLETMTLVEWVLSGKAENNWMTRFLTNKMEGPVETEDVILAREILRRKFVVGLLTDMTESIMRFNTFFNWKLNNDQYNCAIHTTANNHPHPSINEGSPEWNALMEENKYDMELYLYAIELFQQQSSLFVVEDRTEKPILW